MWLVVNEVSSKFGPVSSLTRSEGWNAGRGDVKRGQQADDRSLDYRGCKYHDEKEYF